MLPIPLLVNWGLRILGQALAEQLVRHAAAALGIKLPDELASAPAAAPASPERTADAEPSTAPEAPRAVV